MDNITLKDFLKKYTAISNKFIDKYYSFYEMCKFDSFGIDAELVIKYLGYTEPRKFYEKLRTYYVINNDFIIKRISKPGSNSAKRVIYYITFDCFEKLCMTSKTSIGNSVRDYFITLRKFIDYYKNHFAEKINNLALSKKYVYIILVNKNKNLYKFGRTKNMRKRLYSYATGKETHPDIKFIMIVDDPKRVENCTKIFIEKFKFKNKQELYKIDFDLLKSALFNCAEIIKELDEKIDDKNKFDTYIVYDEYEDHEILDLNNNVIGYEKFYLNKQFKQSKGSKKSKSSKESKLAKSSKGSKGSKKIKSSKSFKGSKKIKSSKGSKLAKSSKGSKKIKSSKGSKLAKSRIKKKLQKNYIEI